MRRAVQVGAARFFWEYVMTELQVCEETTDGVRVLVTPVYLDEQSDAEENQYVWAYQVRLENHGNAPVQLITRRWRITDANGRAHEVIGDGVVGETPILQPGDEYEYSSGTPLSTPSGFMTGIFQMLHASGHRFVVKVPTFSLDIPDSGGPVH